MSKYLLRFAAVIGIFLSVGLSLYCQEASQDEKFAAQAESVIRGAEHQDIPWKVTVHPPRLMYQQTYLVQVRARIDPVALKKVTDTRTLHFILKVQDQKGNWFKGGEYKDYEVPANLGHQSEIEYATGVYFRPGEYNIALLVFDSDSGKSSLARDSVRIPAMNDDPFPELDGYLAPVEFPKGFPQQEVGNDRVDDGELFPVALLGNRVPVGNAQPALVDIVLDITKRPAPVIPQYFDTYGRPIRPRRAPTVPLFPAYEMEVGRVLQTGDLLARLGLQKGCVRISAVDALHMRTILDKADQKTLDWARFEVQVHKLDQDTVDVAVLTNKKGPAQFMRRYLDELSADANACGGGEHYIVLVSHQVSFPAKDEKLPEADRERARFYYLYSQSGITMGDDLGDLLKPVKPERLSFNSPRDLRKAFAKVVSDLRAGK